MELVNATSMAVAYTLGMEPSGQERIVVAIKGTFAFPHDGGEPRLHGEQTPLVMADEFTGDPGFSATLYEAEFPPYKHRCDVVLNGSAYAPGGVPAERVRVGIRVGSLEKAFDVIGDRVWAEGLGVPTDPTPFVVKRITYDSAFGGTDAAPNDDSLGVALEANPVGTGYYPIRKEYGLAGLPLPNTEEIGHPCISPTGKYRPMSFGVIGRAFKQRADYAGTYDQVWQDDVFPFLPSDFDARYYQCVPTDQQMEYPQGGEVIDLFNLTPEGRTSFALPRQAVPVEFTNTELKRTEMSAVLDTVFIEPDERSLSLVWRASIPLVKDVFELTQCVVGRMSQRESE